MRPNPSPELLVLRASSTFARRNSRSNEAVALPTLPGDSPPLRLTKFAEIRASS
jgi:hypothetical protein